MHSRAILECATTRISLKINKFTEISYSVFNELFLFSLKPLANMTAFWFRSELQTVFFQSVMPFYQLTFVKWRSQRRVKPYCLEAIQCRQLELWEQVTKRRFGWSQPRSKECQKEENIDAIRKTNVEFCLPRSHI